MEKKTNKVYVILPAFNEAENIVLLLRSFNQLINDSSYDFSIILVDDGSSDGTDEASLIFVETINITTIRHSSNKGLSSALKSGFLTILDEAMEDDVIICMDADNTHLPYQIIQMLALIESGSDVVIASRFRKESKVRGVSIYRNFLSYMSSFVCRFLIPISGVKDYSCGFRAYRASLIKEALNSGDEIFNLKGFACTSQLLFSLNKLKANFSEIPIDLRYNQKRGVSKMKIIETSLESLRVIFKEWKRRLL